MPAEPLTLFEILGVSYGATADELRAAYEKVKISYWRQKQDVPRGIDTAYDVLSNPEWRPFYEQLLQARRQNTPILRKSSEVKELRDFCTSTFLQVWECPAGLVGPEGRAASLGEVYLLVRLEGEPTPWPEPPPEPAPEVPSRPFATLAKLFVLAVLIVGGFWWYRNQTQSTPGLEETIRRDDAEVTNSLESVTQQEIDFQKEVSSVVGQLPADGSMPDDLARVCFREKEAARAWEEIRERPTLPPALEPMDATCKVIEKRISMGTFIEDDEKQLSDAKKSLREKGASFSELKRDLDLLRVLLEAERLPHK
jgi:hypothetical protein